MMYNSPLAALPHYFFQPPLNRPLYAVAGCFPEIRPRKAVTLFL